MMRWHIVKARDEKMLRTTDETSYAVVTNPNFVVKSLNSTDKTPNLATSGSNLHTLYFNRPISQAKLPT